ncbi:hypothetical protein TIFTF001_036688 [Ficus carica]|uniref:Uncharacterized protein n=1 Tax=Ficus carica TaxID=3494 RepID=A0AA88E8F6_FICCA|nr:hypothetical protein TIFTF001_036688 [Ficus carica]
MRRSRSLNGLISPLGVSISSILKMVVTTAGIPPIARTHSPTNPYTLDGYQDCPFDFQPGEGVHEQDVDGTLVVDQNTSNNAIDYLDFSDQVIVMWVEELVGFIVSKGIASSATCCITNGRSPKNGMDNVLKLSGIGLVIRPRSRVWSDLTGSIGPTCRVLILVPMGTVCHDRRGGPEAVPFRRSGSLLCGYFGLICPVLLGLVLPIRKGWGNIISDCPKQFFVLDSFSKSLSEGVILTCMTALSKRSRYPFKVSFSPCLILKKYKVSFFKVFALRNTAKKASNNCLNESIVLGISLQYHYRAVPVRVKQKAL